MPSDDPILFTFRQADVSRDCLKLYCCTFIFYVNPLFSESRTEYARQMYTWCSVVGKAKIIDSEISPIPPLIFTGGGSKSVKFGLMFNVAHI